MLNIVIVAVGKIKESFYRDAFNEYLKRLSPYARIKVEELKAEPFKSDGDKPKCKELEAERILKLLDNYAESEIFILDERGEEFTSVELSAVFKKHQSRKIVFVVGGTLGLAEEILKNKKYHFLSLSKMTLPHELVRVVLGEQIYRVVCISLGKDYHY
jgi:23S rRNA (pseudouridine1915-N3)-methyltransferase